MEYHFVLCKITNIYMMIWKPDKTTTVSDGKSDILHNDFEVGKTDRCVEGDETFAADYTDKTDESDKNEGEDWYIMT